MVAIPVSCPRIATLSRSSRGPETARGRPPERHLRVARDGSRRILQMPWQLKRTFPIEITEPELDELRRRLGGFTPVPLPPRAGGVDPEAFARLVDYWREAYDWGATQDALNALHHV